MASLLTTTYEKKKNNRSLTHKTMNQKKVYVVTEVSDTHPFTQATQAAATERKFTRLPNPEIPNDEYSLVSSYCINRPNMTRQDWVELAIIEKLHNDGLISDEHFQVRRNEIINRPPRGHRKGTKNK